MLTDEQIEVIGSEHSPYVDHKFSRAIESAACAERDQSIAELEENERAFKQVILQMQDSIDFLQRQLEEARKVLKETGLLLHHFWCDVPMNEYNFEKLNKGMEAIDAAMKGTP